MTITTLPLPETPIQYWYTVDIPTDSGVYVTEVYAPVLPKITASSVTIESAKPHELATPEPSMLILIITGLILGALLSCSTWRRR